MEFFTADHIMVILALLSAAVAVYLSLRKPQEDLDKKQAVAEQAVDGKATLLAQQVQWEKDANEKRFSEFSIRLNDAQKTADNHIHTIDVKVDGLLGLVGGLSNNITRLETIIDERIPKK